LESRRSFNKFKDRYADDAQAGGDLSSLRNWWDLIVTMGPSYGDFANAGKTVLIVKEEHLEEAKRIFSGTGVQFSRARAT
jgi:hypothetical protein